MENFKYLAEKTIKSSDFKTYLRSSTADGVLYFYEINKQFPSTKQFYSVKIPDLLKTIEKTFGVTAENKVTSEIYSKKDEKFNIRDIFFIIEKNLILTFISYGADEIYNNVTLFYSNKTNSRLLKKTCTFLSKHQIVDNDSEIGIVGNGAQGLYIRFFKVNVPSMNIKQYYNDDFFEIHNKIIEKLNSHSKGVVLFHGCPGTGKTSYLRHLSSLIKKRMIFITQEMAAKIASPDFITLLMDYPNSILIMEDAENVIKDRNSNASSPVANILNISDGLLSDCLNLQVICTFNTDIKSIDKALLRKGRIITDYEFKPLNVKKANALSSLNGSKTEFKNDATLAEIFNSDDIDFSSPERTKVGFKLENLLKKENNFSNDGGFVYSDDQKKEIARSKEIDKRVKAKAKIYPKNI